MHPCNRACGQGAVGSWLGLPPAGLSFPGNSFPGSVLVSICGCIPSCNSLNNKSGMGAHLTQHAAGRGQGTETSGLALPGVWPGLVAMPATGEDRSPEPGQPPIFPAATAGDPGLAGVGARGNGHDEGWSARARAIPVSGAPFVTSGCRIHSNRTRITAHTRKRGTTCAKRSADI